MRMCERVAGDLDRLRALACAEKNAEQRDRFLSALHAASGVPEPTISAMLCRSRRFVQRWAYAYRDHGIGALGARPRGGSRPKITGDNLARLRARIDEGPRPEDGVCTLRGKDIRRIARDELGADVSLASVYRTLHAMGYSCLAPRPRHEHQDPEAQRKFKDEDAPFFSAR